MARPILSRAVRNARAMMRASEWGDSSIPPNGSVGPWGSGGGMAGEFAVSTVLACVQVLHDDATTMRFAAQAGSRYGPHQVLDVQPRIVTEPFGPDLETAQGLGQVIVSRVMRGNAFLFHVSTDPTTQLPTQLMVLHPDAVSVFRDRDGSKLFRVQGEVYTTKDITHIAGMMAPGAVAGVDVLTAQRQTYEAALDVARYGKRFFHGGGSPSVVIEAPGSGDRKKIREVKAGWVAAHGGVEGSHEPAVVFGGAKVTPLSVTPENAQFLETRRFMREEICGLFKVPLQRIQAIADNASQGGGKGLDAIDSGYVKHTMLPLVAPIERAWSRMIPGGGRTWVAFDFNEFLRADAHERAEIAQIHRVTGVRTRDEIRADEGWDPLPDGQGVDPNSPLNSNASPTGGADNAPAADSMAQSEQHDPRMVLNIHQTFPDRETKVDVHNAYEIDATTHIADDAVHVDVDVAAPQVEVDARTTVARGAVELSVPAPPPPAPAARSSRRVETDAAGRITRIVDEDAI